MNTLERLKESAGRGDLAYTVPMSGIRLILALALACQKSVDECHSSCASWDQSSDCDCGYVARCLALEALESG